MIDNYAKDKLTLMIHTQFGGRINFAINSDNKFQLDPVSKGSSFLLEEAQDIFECFSDRAAQMARLDQFVRSSDPPSSNKYGSVTPVGGSGAALEKISKCV